MSEDRISKQPLRIPVAQPALPIIRLPQRPRRQSWSAWQVAIFSIGVCITGMSLSFCFLCVIVPLGCEFIDRLALRVIVGGPPIAPPFFGF